MPEAKVIHQEDVEVEGLGTLKIEVKENHVDRMQTILAMVRKERGIKTIQTNPTAFTNQQENPVVDFYYKREVWRNNQKDPDERLERDEVRRIALEEAAADYEAQQEDIMTQVNFMLFLSPNFVVEHVNDLYYQARLADHLPQIPLEPADFNNSNQREEQRLANRYVFPTRNEISPLEQKIAYIQKLILSDIKVQSALQEPLKRAGDVLNSMVRGEEMDDAGFHNEPVEGNVEAEAEPAG